MDSTNKNAEPQVEANKTKHGFGAMPVVVVVVVVVVVCAVSLAFWSVTNLNRMIFNANASSLEETYREVAQTYAETSKARWHYLDQFADYLELAEKQGLSSAEVKETFDDIGLSYTDFYLVNSNGTYVTLGGDSGYLDLGTNLVNLITGKQSVVSEGSMPGRENMIFYAVPTEESTFNGFTYYAVALGYDRASVAKSITVASYQDKSFCYLVYRSGRVAFALTDDDLHVNNVLTTLEESGLSEQERQEAQEALANGETYTTRIKRNGKTYYMSFQEAGFANNMLVSYTEDSAVNTSLDDISSAVGFSIGGIVIFLGAAVLFFVIVWYRRGIRARDAQLEEKDLVFSLISEDMDSVYILMRGANHQIIYVSPSVERLLGVPVPVVMLNPHALDVCSVDKAPTQELIKANFDELKPGQKTREECMLANALTGKQGSFACETYRPTGANSDMVMLVITDRTEEERVLQGVRDALEVARVASESKSNFLANMSHDIRTPMNAIVGFSNLAEQSADDPTKVRGYIEKIQASAQHLLSLINDVLDMSKIEAGKTTLEAENLDIAASLKEVCDITETNAHDKGVTFETHFELEPSATVLADHLRLNQVLLNILGNAVKYTPEGGTVTFNVKRMDKGFSPYAQYRFVIADTGIGMSPEFIETIWSPFSRENRGDIKSIQGTGLGMAITKNIIDLMGGTISVRSELGKGSTFDVVLEFKISETARAEIAETSTAEGALQGLHILAAEDNALNAELLSDLLDMDGATVEIATDGQEALNTFASSKPGTYDLILMDVQMPIMDGYAATRAIRGCGHDEAKDIPIIAMTANAFAEDVAKALESGMDAHVAKPIDMNTLRSTVARVLTEKSKK